MALQKSDNTSNRGEGATPKYPEVEVEGEVTENISVLQEPILCLCGHYVDEVHVETCLVFHRARVTLNRLRGWRPCQNKTY